MQIPVEITYRDVQKSEEIENLIYEKVEKLERICGWMIRCNVTLEQPQKHQRSGNPYRVRIEITIPPGHELIVKREAGEGDMHDSLATVIRQAFDAARRKVQDQVEKQHKEVKQHPDQEVQAFVSKIFPQEGYGFLKSREGRDVYFHKNSVLNDDFERLNIGTGVRYVEEEGEKGLQASTVAIVDKPPRL